MVYRTSKLAGASLVLGLLTILLACMGIAASAVPFLLAMLGSGLSAIIVGALGWGVIRRSNSSLYGLGMASCGIAIPLIIMLFVGVAVPAT